MPELSVVIATRDRPELLERCMKALHRLEGPRPELVVVDASSTDQSRLVAKEHGVNVYIDIPLAQASIPFQENQGVAASREEIIALIDDDAFPEPDWLQQILSTFEGRPEAGVVGGRVIDPTYWPWDEQTPIGKVYPDGRITHGFNGNPGKAMEVDWVPGVNMIFRREVFQAVGGFDQNFEGTASGFEADFCLRVQYVGYKIFFNPGAVVYHLPASQRPIGRDAGLALYHAKRNQMYLLRKHFPNKRLVLGRALIRVLFWYQWKLFAINGVRTIFSYLLGIAGALSGLSRPIPPNTRVNSEQRHIRVNPSTPNGQQPIGTESPPKSRLL